MRPARLYGKIKMYHRIRLYQEGAYNFHIYREFRVFSVRSSYSVPFHWNTDCDGIDQESA